MTPDQQEALSRNCSPACRILLRLSSGNYALFGNDRLLICIGTLEEVCAHPAITEYIEQQAPKPKVPVTLNYLTEGLDL